jgi:hypothetical protein
MVPRILSAIAVTPAGEPDVARQILCTNALKSIMTKLAPALERESGSKPALRWGSTVALVDALADGADGDSCIRTIHYEPNGSLSVAALHAFKIISWSKDRG